MGQSAYIPGWSTRLRGISFCFARVRFLSLNLLRSFYYPAHRFKAIIFALVRQLSFQLAVPAEAITTVPGILTKPMVAYEKEVGFQLPLRVSRVSQLAE